MTLNRNIWPDPASHLRAATPDHPVFYFAPERLRATAARFARGFPGLVTYAVKANDARMVLENLAAGGMRAFDVASPVEMRKLRAVCPDAVLHYNNPIRSVAEIEAARAMGAVSYSVDCAGELDKLAAHLPRTGVEIAVRLKLPVPGAAYDFGEKFGATEEEADALLARVAALGFTPAMTFHPGTQCADPAAWAAYIAACAGIAARAGVRLARLNVGGGFAAHRAGPAPDLEAIFAAIATATTAAFGPDAPALVCEPGRAMVAEAFSLAARVKAIRPGGQVFLNDGIYGGFAEAPLMGNTDRIEVLDSHGQPRGGVTRPCTVFGPTCDSLDKLPGTLALPADLAEGDYLLFHGMGAYTSATATRFNGYGDIAVATVHGAS